MFAQPFDHSFNDLFNQYVNVDSSSTDGNKDVPFPCDFDQMFPLDSISNDCGGQSPTASTPQHTCQSAHPWGKDAWGLSQNADCSTNQDNLLFEDSNQAPATLNLSVGLEVPSVGHPPVAETRSPSTPPATPGHKAKANLLTPKSIRRHRGPHDRCGPSLIRSSQVQKSAGRMVYPEAWAQRLQQNFTLRSADECLPLSPPPSDILVQQENISTKHPSTQMNRAVAELPQQLESSYFNHSPAIPMPSSASGPRANQPQRYLNRPNTSTLTPSPPSADDIFSSPHSSDPQSMSSWNPDSLPTAFQFTPELQNHDAQTWWSPIPSGAAQRQASYQHMIASPAPQRPIQTSANNSDLLQGGLMIQLDPTSYDISSSFPSSSIPSTNNSQDSQSYNHGAHAPQEYVDSASFTTPKIQDGSQSPTLSPNTDASPKNGSAIPNEMLIKTTSRRSHGRKLSGQSTITPKPLKRPNSLSGSPKGGSKSVTVSFVNFTAQDSQKILTGVAPSGSSKTKARREQEARERRRKLSEAALNAVRKAGGDVEALEAVFC
ncbi:developmental regulatory protein WetA [Aspergillus lucknowensis]|uniref:Developmental regulatory protein wetA n=1 Tax=Aspergillus lucknowensis TaxID=176173 RepID=A0ABR4M146_9EURO